MEIVGGVSPKSLTGTLKELQKEWPPSGGRSLPRLLRARRSPHQYAGQRREVAWPKDLWCGLAV